MIRRRIHDLDSSQETSSSTFLGVTDEGCIDSASLGPSYPHTVVDVDVTADQPMNDSAAVRSSAANTAAPRPSTARHTRRRVVQLLAASTLALPLSACGSGGSGSEPISAPSDGPSAPGEATDTTADNGSFRVVIGDTTLTGHLFDNATTRDLQSQLPLTLHFSDLNEVEKIARLPRKLSVDGMPAGDDPRVGELGYWAPSGNLVLYYGDVGYWTGIMRIGEFDGSMDAIAVQSGDFDATVEPTE